MDEMIQPGYKIILYDGREFKECTVNNISTRYITLKEDPYYQYFYGEKDHTLFIEFESGYSYDTIEYSYAIKGDATEFFKERLKETIEEQEKRVIAAERKLKEYKEMFDFIC